MDALGIPPGQPVLTIDTLDQNGDTFGVQLTDHTLPDRGLGLPIEHRIVKSNPVGAYEPIVQRVGFVLQPFTMTGTLDDANMAETGGSEAVSGLFYRMAAGGRPCTMAYSDKWTMEGYIRRYTPSYQEDGRITWSLEFDPTKCSLVDRKTYTTQQQYVRSAAETQSDAIRAVAISIAIQGIRQSVTRTNVIRSFALGAT